MKKHLRAMLEALITDDTAKASEHLHAYLAATTRRLVLGEEDKEENEEDEEDVDDKKENPFKKKSKKKSKSKKDDNDDDDEKDDVCKKCGKSPCKCKKDVKEMDMYSGKYRRNEKGEVFNKSKRGKAEGYNNPKGNKLTADPKSGAAAPKGKMSKSTKGKSEGYDNPNGNKLKADPKSGANEGKRPVGAPKGKSEGYDNPKGKKGLGMADKGSKSPDSDGRKDNRRTDKAKGYHGKSRGGKDLG